MPIAALRLAWIHGRETGDFGPAFREIEQLKGATLDKADTIAVASISDLIQCEKGSLTFAELSVAYDGAITELLAMPAGSYPEVLPAELQIQKTWAAVLDGKLGRARVLLDRFFERLPRNDTNAVMWNLATAALNFHEYGAGRALASTAGAQLAAARVARGCLIEVVAVNHALMFAAAGRHNDARLALVEAGLPLEAMPPFWEPEQTDVLQARLKSACYIK